MKDGKYQLVPLTVTILMLTSTLVACRTAPAVKSSSTGSVKQQKAIAAPPETSAAEFKKLSYGIATYLDSLGDRKFQQQRKYIVSTAPYIKSTIRAYEKATPTAPMITTLSSCGFVAVRIELDNKIETVEWLVTTTGKGQCEPSNKYQPKTYWLVQHRPNQQPRVVYSGRGSTFLLKRINKGEVMRRLEVRKKNKVEGEEFICYEYYQNKGKGYKRYDKKTEAYISTPQIPSKTWQATDNPQHKCRP